MNFRTKGNKYEKVAAGYLRHLSYELVALNWCCRWGEIDIIAKKSGMIHFIEVKSVTCLASTRLDSAKRASDSESRRAHATSEYRPEDNMHPWKLKRLARAIQTYLLDRKLDCDWQLDLVTVKIDQQNRTARVELIENVII